MSGLVLSLFPGIDLLGRAFEEEGFCIVRGPDVLWGGDVRAFHPPAGVFDGIIGGPPCQHWSRMANVARARGQKVAADLIPEYERVVLEAAPRWFVMENVPAAPAPYVAGYFVQSFLLNNRWVGGEQNRLRRISFGSRDARIITVEELPLEPAEYHGAVLARGTVWNAEKKRPEPRRSQADYESACVAQGLPADFLSHAPFTLAGKWRVVGNGVPLPMGRAIARAVRAAL